MPEAIQNGTTSADSACPRQLVEEAFAHPNVNGVVRLGVHCDHNHTCCLQWDKEVSSTIADFILRAIIGAREDMVRQSLDDCKPDYSCRR